MKRGVRETLVVVPLAWLLLVNGCATPEDRAFRAAVGPVLSQAGELHSTLSIAASAATTEGMDMLDAVAKGSWAPFRPAVAAYREAVVRLPQPTSKNLRYLKMRLLSLGQAADKLGVSLARSRDYTGLNSEEEIRSRFKNIVEKSSAAWMDYYDVLELVGATEHVVLGTNTIRDQSFAGELGGTRDSAKNLGRLDSLFDSKEGFVRKELATLR